MKIIAKLLFISLLYSNVPTFAQIDNRGIGNKSQSSEKRLALVIGNSNYQFTDKLKNPVNDANDVATALRALGFDVILGTDLSLNQMRKIVRDFGAKLQQQKGIGLFYYAGHGIQMDGRNYLIPVDANIETAVETPDFSFDTNTILQFLRIAENDFNLVILDACRNNPFARSWRQFSPNRAYNEEKGLAPSNPPRGTVILYSTEPGNVASDGTGRNGLFTESFLKQITKPNVEFEAMVKFLYNDLSGKSAGKQTPWREGLYGGEFYFKIEQTALKPNDSQTAILTPTPKPTPLPTPTPVSASGNFDAESVYWKEIESRNNKIGYELYLAEYPNGKFAQTAKDKIKEFNNQEILRLKNIEKNKWLDAVQQNTKEAYNSYLYLYPSGDFATNARQKIKEIENEENRIAKERQREEARIAAEAEAAREQTKWNDVSILNRKSAYQSYLKDYPNGKYSSVARTKIKEFEDEESRILLEQQKVKDKSDWEEAEKLKTIKAYEDYLRIHPQGVFASLARLRLSDLGKNVKIDSANLSLENAQEKDRIRLYEELFLKNYNGSPSQLIIATNAAKEFISKYGNDENQKQVTIFLQKWITDQNEKDSVMISQPKFITNSIGMEFVKIPNRNFYMGKYEVTQEEYQKIIGSNPSKFKCLKCPVEQVSLSEIQVFIEKLSFNESKKYRLPTAEEFEYALRGDTTTQYYWGDDFAKADDYAWYEKNAGSKTQPVGRKKPNNYGLYDMVGNVWERCYSRDGNSGLIRGGGWFGNSDYMRSASAFFHIGASSYVGFRLVLLYSN